MRFAWFGVHAEGLPALEALLEQGAPIRDLFTLRPGAGVRRNGSVDFREICERHAITYHEIANINDADTLRRLERATPDFAFVIGWPQTVKGEAIAAVKHGMIGAHASALPQNAGAAPINWMIIHGDEVCGSSLIWLQEHRDAPEVIDQEEFPITPYDTYASLLARVAIANREMLLRLVPRLLAGEIPHPAPTPVAAPPLPRRRAVDGELDWGQPTRAVYDTIRGLSRPAPGAFSSLDGRRWRVWQAAWPRFDGPVAAPGTILGPVVSPVDEACGQLVACEGGALVLLELEGDDGQILRGRVLSEQPWTGQRWHRG